MKVVVEEVEDRRKGREGKRQEGKGRTKGKGKNLDDAERLGWVVDVQIVDVAVQ